MDFNEAFQPTGGTTGRSLVLFEEGAAEAGMQAVQEAVGVQVVAASGDEATPAAGGGILFESLGVAVVDAPPDQVMQRPATPRSWRSSPSGSSTRSRRRVLVDGGNGRRRRRRRRPAAAGRASPPSRRAQRRVPARLPRGGAAPDRRRRGRRSAAAAGAVIAAVDESQATWGLQVTKVVNCCRTGKGMRVAVLDTGFDLQHPDFAGRSVTTQSFIAGEEVQDGHGHGTHCIGTALGAKCPGMRPRYGVAHEAEIFAGKVLSNAGSGSDTGILAGIEWAVQNKCAVISMSLGAATQPGQAFSQVFESVARRAQERAR